MAMAFKFSSFAEEGVANSEATLVTSKRSEKDLPSLSPIVSTSRVLPRKNWLRR